MAKTIDEIIESSRHNFAFAVDDHWLELKGLCEQAQLAAFGRAAKVARSWHVADYAVDEIESLKPE